MCFRRVSYFITAAVVLISACGPGRTGNYVTVNGFSLGTTYRITVNSPDTAGMQQAVDSLFRAINLSMSIHEPNSLLNRLNRNETDSVDRHIAYCVETAAIVSEQSGGEYDITVKPLIDAWGFNAEPVQMQPDIDSLLEFVGHRRIRIADGRLVKDDPRIQIDLNSIAKGYAVDRLAELIADRGIGDFLVEVGGEIVCRGLNSRGKEWRIGIDRPEDGNNIPGAELQAVIMLSDAAMATSGNYRKFYTTDDGRKVVHSVNALTGMGQTDKLLSATVVAGECALADAYGTMLMVIGWERAKEFLKRDNSIEGYLVGTDEHGHYEIHVSPGLERKIVR